MALDLRDLLEGLADCFAQFLTGLGECCARVGAVDQQHPEPRFQPLESVAQPRGVDTQLQPCAAKAAMARDRQEISEVGKVGTAGRRSPDLRDRLGVGLVRKGLPR